jgi:hypothetical protein
MILREFIKNKFSVTALLIVAIVLTWVCFNLKLWNTDQPIKNDVFSYYIYLPALVIENDLKLTFRGMENKSQYDHLWIVPAPNGNIMTKMGVGISYLYSPFFFIGHFSAPVFNYPQDGFSDPYVIALILGSVFYALVGMIFIAKILLLYFSDLVTGITIILIGLATNLLCYTTLDSLMPHVFNFFLISTFIYLSIQWHKNPGYTISVLAGLTFGIIVVARPTNAVIILFPLLYSINNVENFKSKWLLIRNNYRKLLIAALFMLIAIIPQLLYWKHVTGNFIYYSYNDEGFYFNNPKIIQGLIGFRKGWLIYTPVMIFGLWGIYFIYKKIPQLFLSIVIFTLLNIYIIFSWWCWWYGGGFSARPMIDSYAVMAIPLAAIISNYIHKNLLSRILVFVVSGLFISLNAFQTYQFKSSLLHYDSMTKDAYFAIFGKLYFPDNYTRLIEHPDYDNARAIGKELHVNKENNQ